MEVEYIREKTNAAVKDIIKNDCRENKKQNLEGMDITIINMCDIFKIITHEQAEEIRKPIIEELEKITW